MGYCIFLSVQQWWYWLYLLIDACCMVLGVVPACICAANAWTFYVPLALNPIKFRQAPDKFKSNFGLHQILWAVLNFICDKVLLDGVMVVCQSDKTLPNGRGNRPNVWWNSIYSFGKVFHVFEALLCWVFCTCEAVFIETCPKCKKTLTFWSWSWCRFCGDTLSPIVRNVLGDGDKQIFW